MRQHPLATTIFGLALLAAYHTARVVHDTGLWLSCAGHRIDWTQTDSYLAWCESIEASA